MKTNKSDNDGFNRKYLIKNVSITQVCSGFSIATGVFLDALILASFGIGTETDALFAAMALPLLIVSTIEVEAPKVLVPTVTKSLAEEGEEKTHHLLSNVITTFAFLLTGLALLNLGLAWLLIPIQVPGLAAGTLKLAISLCFILSWLILVRGIESILRPLLYARHEYFIPSSVKFVSNVVVIACILALSGQMGIHAVALGFVLGGIVSVSILFLALSRRGFSYRWVLQVRDPALRRTLSLSAYPLMGDGLGRSVELVENFLASFLGSGSLSILRYASRIMSAMAGILIGGISTATLPMVSHFATSRNLEKMKKSLLSSLKLLLFIALPMLAWLVLTSQPMLILMFERGEFTRNDAILVATIVAFLAPAILFARLSAIIQTSFFATVDMKTPFICRLVGFAFTVGLMLVLTQVFGLYGFPFARSLGMLAALTVTVYFFNRKFGALDWRSLDTFGFRLFGLLVMTGLGLVSGLLLNDFVPLSGWYAKFSAFAIPTTVGATAFIVGALLFKFVTPQVVYSAFRGERRSTV